MKQVFKYLPQGKKVARLVFEQERNEKNVTFGVIGNKKEVFTFMIRHFEDVVKFDFIKLSDVECKEVWEKEEKKSSKGKKKTDVVQVAIGDIVPVTPEAPEVVHTCIEPPAHTCAEPPVVPVVPVVSKKKRLSKEEKLRLEQQKQIVDNNNQLLAEDAPKVSQLAPNDNSKLYFRFKNLMFEKAKTGKIVYVYRVRRVQKVANVPVYDEQHVLMDQFQLREDFGIWKKECELYYFNEFYRPYDNNNIASNKDFVKEHAKKLKNQIEQARQRYISESLDANKKEKEKPVNPLAFDNKEIPQIEKKPAPYPKRNAN